MTPPAWFEKGMQRFLPPVLGWLYGRARAIPWMRKRIEKQYAGMLEEVAGALKPYQGLYPGFARLPPKGLSRAQVLEIVEGIAGRESPRWEKGFASGAVYHGDEEHIAFLNRVYALNSQSNPLHADLWPSSSKFESEAVSMTAGMLHGGPPHAPDACGVVSSGGTESILLAVKTYRDRARAEKGIRTPEMVVPVTAHAAFDKAAQYFGIKIVHIPVDREFQADPQAAREAVGPNTVLLAGSAPAFPHGVIDPIEALAELARDHDIGFHTDACLGGFVLPWAEKLGAPVPSWDFRVPGVTSISVDTHKYGYAAKGTSVILYRDPALRRYQYFKATDWPGGLYFSPTFAGSRPGGLSAACWAAMVSLGERGYLEATERILKAARTIKTGIRRIPELRILGDPLWVIAFTSDTLDIYRIMDAMAARGWSLNGLHRPPALHLCVTLRHAQSGVAERFVEDLREAVVEVREKPRPQGGMAPVYGLAAKMPVRGVVGELLERYMDLLYASPEEDEGPAGKGDV